MKGKCNLVKAKFVLMAILGMLSMAPLEAQIKVLEDGRVGVGTTTPHSAAKLQIYSDDNSQGFLLPRVTIAQRDSPIMQKTDGLQVYVEDDDDDVRGPYYWDEILQMWIKMDAKNISWADIDDIPNSIDDQTLATDNTPGNISISEGNEIIINVGDADNSNELQTLQLNGSHLSISNGNIVDLSTIQAEDPNAWKLTGNNSDANDFLGTTGIAPLRIGTGGDEVIRVSENGDVGIGLTNPLAKLHISGNIIQEYPSNLKNIVIGRLAGNENMAAADGKLAEYNIFMGYQSGEAATSADFNNFMGYQSGKSSTTARGNNFIGRETGRDNTTGGLNNFFGWIAGRANTIGSYNNFFGPSTGTLNVDGSHNNFFGSSAGAGNLSGSYNNFFGLNAGYENETGESNIYIGKYAGKNSVATSTNNFIGHEAGFNHTVGNHNNYIGNGAGKYSAGAYNNFIGLQAGSSNSGSYNIGVGNSAGKNATGIHNIALGTGALQEYTESTDNSSGGNGFNIAIGGSALQNGANQGHNIGIGWKSLQNNNGKKNVSIGYFAADLATGDYNVALGAHAGKQSAGGGVFLGFGAGAQETTGNKLYIENSDATSPLIYGDFDSDRLRVNGTLEVRDRAGLATVGAAYDANDQLVETTLITNNNQLINGAAYITTANLPATVTWATLTGKPSEFADDEDAGSNVQLLSYTNNGDEIHSFVDGPHVLSTFKEGPGINLENDSPFLKISSVEVDGDVTNELQDLYLNGTLLGIDNGNEVDLGFLQNDPLAWRTIGNNAAVDAKLGTLNSQPLRLITAGSERVRVDENGQVGIGTQAPESNLHVQGNLLMNKGATPEDDFSLTSIGLNAGTIGNHSTYIGDQAGQNASGWNNNFLGPETGINNTGSNNIFMGHKSGNANTTGAGNVFMGQYSGDSNENGWYNVYMGWAAGSEENNGNNNILIGYKADFSDDNVEKANSIAIGANVEIDASNIVRIGDGSMTSIGGEVIWTAFSDGRFKDNTVDNVPGIDFIKLLRPLQYNFNATKFHDYLGIDPQHRDTDAEKTKYQTLKTGFIAQEVEQAANSIGFDFSGVDKPHSQDGYYGLRYAAFVVPLVKATQEQQAIIEAQEIRIADLEKQLGQQPPSLEKILLELEQLKEKVKTLENK